MFSTCFLKLFFVLENKENKENPSGSQFFKLFSALENKEREKTRLVPFFFFFFVLRNTKDTKIGEQEQWCFFCFQKLFSITFFKSRNLLFFIL